MYIISDHGKVCLYDGDKRKIFDCNKAVPITAGGNDFKLKRLLSLVDRSIFYEKVSNDDIMWMCEYIRTHDEKDVGYTSSKILVCLLLRHYPRHMYQCTSWYVIAISSLSSPTDEVYLCRGNDNYCCSVLKFGPSTYETNRQVVVAKYNDDVIVAKVKDGKHNSSHYESESNILWIKVSDSLTLIVNDIDYNPNLVNTVLRDKYSYVLDWLTTHEHCC